MLSITSMVGTENCIAVTRIQRAAYQDLGMTLRNLQGVLQQMRSSHPRLGGVQMHLGLDEATEPEVLRCSLECDELVYRRKDLQELRLLHGKLLHADCRADLLRINGDFESFKARVDMTREDLKYSFPG
eukprot:Protomagalhaensia_sp_Gyna_25__1478@NODE_1753_length_1560_cov_45_871137_g1436_i0_p2_GENE_NODE_1753_length_1560_cov_45_871137_g1436_i0NODE_1753_length_1560_cov_45_871137_g1436_i0_p2_ORF_typecomplete_len129_score11_26_NODE_1753_length_1560_cov_45_871137_g1436_i091477